MDNNLHTRNSLFPVFVCNVSVLQVYKLCPHPAYIHACEHSYVNRYYVQVYFDIWLLSVTAATFQYTLLQSKFNLARKMGESEQGHTGGRVGGGGG